MRNRVGAVAWVSLIGLAQVGCGQAPAGIPLRGGAATGAQAAAVAGEILVKYRSDLADGAGHRVLRLAPGQSPEQAAAALEGDPAVEWAEPNWIFEGPDLFDRRRRAPRRPPGLGFDTNDPVGARQWHAPKIQAQQAWRASTGQGVVVAIVDTGVDLDHPDLRANLVPGANTLEPAATPRDDNGHGTHVAGIVAAVANNGIGVAGVAPRAKIMPIRALGDMGGTAQSVAAGIQVAVDRGAAVINLSLGSARPSKAIASAIRYALGKGTAVVAAMGNAGDQGNPRTWPASYPGVIAVGALDPADETTGWSSWGAWQAVSAPGYGIWSTFPTYETSLYRLAKQNPGAIPPETRIELEYAAISGTSQAAPIVAGVAALLKGLDSGLSPARIRERLMQTARDLGPAGFDPHFGAGMVNAAAAVRP